MLIPNKYSGYQAGHRIYPIGGGVGEAMLIGAAVGGGSAAITGGDPLKGALLGGLTGGAGGALGGALSGAAGGEAAALAGGAGSGAGAAGSSLLPAGQSFAQASQAANAATAAQSAAAAANAPTAALNASMANAMPLSAQYANAGMFQPLAAASAAPSGISALPAAQAAAPVAAAPSATSGTFTQSLSKFASDPLALIKANPMTSIASGMAGAIGGRREYEEPDEEYDGPLSRFRYDPERYRPSFAAQGGIMSLAGGGYDRVVGDPSTSYMADGGISSLGSYSDGGRMLKGPGDGMSDSIPASIGGRRPARLADGEFVVPADVVSHLGNGSTDAGAKQLYSMMDKVRSARTGTKKQGRQINPQRYMPA